MNGTMASLQLDGPWKELPGTTADNAFPADPSGIGAYLPFASPAILWRPRYVVQSTMLGQLPLLFWILETIRPRAVAQIGMGDGLVYMAICQALEQLGTFAPCVGIQPEQAPLLPPTLHQQHEAQYGDFSTLISGDITAPPPQLGDGIDLLVLHQALEPEDLEAVLAGWLPRLSDRAVILICRPEMGSGDACAPHPDHEADSRVMTGLTAPGDRKLDVILHGANQPDRLLRLASSAQGKSSKLFMRQVFSRLGKGLEDMLEIKGLQQSHAAVEEALAAEHDHKRQVLAEQLADALAAGHELADWRERAMAAEAALHKARNQQQRADEAATASLVKIEALANLRLRMEARIVELEAEAGAQRDALERQRDEGREIAALQSQEAEGRKRDQQLLAVLRGKLTKTEAELTRLQAETGALERQLAEANELFQQHANHVQAMLDSTSWRVTRPLRSFKDVVLRRRRP